MYLLNPLKSRACLSYFLCDFSVGVQKCFWQQLATATLLASYEINQASSFLPLLGAVTRPLCLLIQGALYYLVLRHKSSRKLSQFIPGGIAKEDYSAFLLLLLYVFTT